MPLFHMAGSGWVFVGLYEGATTVVLRDVDPAAILDSVVRHRITNMLLVPAVIQMMLGTPGVEDADFSSVRAIVYGASPITDDVLVRGLERFGCEFLQVYGLTETTGSITQLDDHDPVGRPELLRSCGKPYPWVELRIVDDGGRDVPVGTVGEVWTRSAQNMLGYWNNPDATAATVTDDGWLKTGDAGYVDRDGYVYLHDRKKDMIVSGGENVYPIEVENVLMTHPAVDDVAVIGVPDGKWGEAVKAVVVRGRRHRTDRGRTDRLRTRTTRRVQAAQVGRLRRGAAPQPQRQTAQTGRFANRTGQVSSAGSADRVKPPKLTRRHAEMGHVNRRHRQRRRHRAGARRRARRRRSACRRRAADHLSRARRPLESGRQRLPVGRGGFR